MLRIARLKKLKMVKLIIKMIKTNRMITKIFKSLIKVQLSHLFLTIRRISLKNFEMWKNQLIKQSCNNSEQSRKFKSKPFIK
jgi:hypothetical protein